MNISEQIQRTAAEKEQALSRALVRCMSKLAEPTLGSVADDIIREFRASEIAPRRCANALSLAISQFAMRQDIAGSSFPATCAALVATIDSRNLQYSVGTVSCVNTIRNLFNALDCTNQVQSRAAATFLAFAHTYDVLPSTVFASLILECMKALTPMKLDVMFILLRDGGARLRRNAPTRLTQILAELKKVYQAERNHMISIMPPEKWSQYQAEAQQAYASGAVSSVQAYIDMMLLPRKLRYIYEGILEIAENRMALSGTDRPLVTALSTTLSAERGKGKGFTPPGLVPQMQIEWSDYVQRAIDLIFVHSEVQADVLAASATQAAGSARPPVENQSEIYTILSNSVSAEDAIAMLSGVLQKGIMLREFVECTLNLTFQKRLPFYPKIITGIAMQGAQRGALAQDKARSEALCAATTALCRDTLTSTLKGQGLKKNQLALFAFFLGSLLQDNVIGWTVFTPVIPYLSEQSSLSVRTEHREMVVVAILTAICAKSCQLIPDLIKKGAGDPNNQRDHQYQQIRDIIGIQLSWALSEIRNDTKCGQRLKAASRAPSTVVDILRTSITQLARAATRNEKATFSAAEDQFVRIVKGK